MKSKRPQGRPPKRSAVPYEMTEALQSYMNANLGEHGGLPRPERLPSVLAAVLGRIARRDPEEWRYCLQRMATIANLDVALFVPEERIEYEVSVELERLAFGHSSKETHYRDTLRSQRGALLDFFRQEHFPHDVRDSGVVKKWLAVHWTRILALLTLIPCYCRYTSLSYNEFSADKITQTHSRWWGQARTTDLIIAVLHNTTPENLRRLLKASRPDGTEPHTDSKDYSTDPFA